MSSVLATVSGEIADLATQAGASIVRVEGRNRLPASGVIFSADGVIVTSNHVVERDDNLKVGLPDGTTVVAELIGRDPATDLALLRVAATGLTAASWVDAGELRVGHLVLALGRPGQSVQATLGIVSALGKAWRSGAGGDFDRYLQTDVVMYPGFSGGPLATAGGALAGINSSALARGVSVTIPAATIQRVAATLLAHGRMPRGYLGIGIQPVHISGAPAEQLGRSSGLMIMSVEEGGPAAAANLLQGDVLVALDGQPIAQMDDLQGLLAGRAGQSATASVVRAGALLEIALTIGEK